MHRYRLTLAALLLLQLTLLVLSSAREVSRRAGAYLNQVALMSGVLAADPTVMAAKADAMFPSVQRGGLAYIGLMRDEPHSPVTADQGWAIIQREIDAGVLTLAGHSFVAVGYRVGGPTREVIAHDPFGRWNGRPCSLLPAGRKGNDDHNTPDALSAKGRGVSYSFDTVFGPSNSLISVQGRRVDAHLAQS